jgi:uncharacterized protein YjgD (DUF1641 family)
LSKSNQGKEEKRTMAQPISFKPPQRDPREELFSRLQSAPAEHAEAVLAAYEVLQGLHDRGVLDLMRGALGAGDQIIETVVDVAKSPEAIRSIRNLLLLTRALATIDPELLSDFTDALPRAIAQAHAEESQPPGLLKLLGTFWNRDFRRGLAALNGLVVIFGKNLSRKKYES